MSILIFALISISMPTSILCAWSRVFYVLHGTLVIAVRHDWKHDFVADDFEYKVCTVVLVEVKNQELQYSYITYSVQYSW